MGYTHLLREGRPLTFHLLDFQSAGNLVSIYEASEDGCLLGHFLVGHIGDKVRRWACNVLVDLFVSTLHVDGISRRFDPLHLFAHSNYFSSLILVDRGGRLSLSKRNMFRKHPDLAILVLMVLGQIIIVE